ncbi:sodium/potassium/calcium exchanger zydeco isoform X2 [Megalopta genalis]|uniref:sodium/potassium/calcium exchanger zydeco isoform X2 n=1 Tax=Megalopta genalis TaxID=115081 RepID=UPI003FD1BF63
MREGTTNRYRPRRLRHGESEFFRKNRWARKRPANNVVPNKTERNDATAFDRSFSRSFSFFDHAVGSIDDDLFLSYNRCINCTPPAIEDFPHDLFDEKERQGGAVVVHVIVSLYLFIALAVVCDKFFVPAVEKICHALSMSKDVAGATFMAAATSAPELFVNAIGTFITEGDIGVGTIVGSAVFNILAVPACCGIGAGMVVPLDWWPVSRDCLAYGVTVAILICIIHDERVEWYEALALVLLYIVYIAVMYWDKSFQRCTRFRDVDQSSLDDHRLAGGKTHGGDGGRGGGGGGSLAARIACGTERGILLRSEFSRIGHENSIEIRLASTDKVQPANDQAERTDVPLQNGGTKTQEENPEPDYEYELLVWPARAGWIRKTAWILTWPIHLIFMCTIPDCEKQRFKNWFPVTFLMCIIWIGSLSYVVAWMITIIGDTLKIPDSVMGITFLAAGTSVPEAVSSVIVAKQGHGSMGISNSIGSNTFDILLCLGLPWLIKSSFSPTQPGKHYISINSGGLEYSAISLLSTLMLLYIAFASNKFQLDRKGKFAHLSKDGQVIREPRVERF